MLSHVVNNKNIMCKQKIEFHLHLFARDYKFDFLCHGVLTGMVCSLVIINMIYGATGVDGCA